MVADKPTDNETTQADDGAAEVADAAPSPGTADIAGEHRVTVDDAEFLVITDVAASGDALIEHRLAVEPGIIELTVPKTWDDPFANRIDDFSAGRNLHLAGCAGGGIS